MPTTLRAVPAPLASYVRPGRNDHGVLVQLLSESKLDATGVVIDATLIARQEELALEAGRQGISTVLDPRSIELSTPAGFGLSGVAELPWAPPVPHRPDDLGGPAGLLLCEELAEFAVKEGLSALLAPTHLIGGPDDPWFDVDLRLADDLRRALDSRGRSATPIYYPLALRSTVLYDDAKRARLIERLADSPVDAIWLRVHPFGATSAGPVALRRYIAACRDLHQLNLPLVAEHSGTVGVPLLAFGAVGGVESGVTFGERFNLDRYLKHSDGKGFLPPPRVYLGELGAFLSRDQAASFFAHRGMRAAHGCQDQRCCRRGWQDMIADPRRHFLVQRGAEVTKLTRTPEQLRAGVYMDDFLRPASDAAARAAAAEPALEVVRRRLDSWRGALGAILTDDGPHTFSPAPTGTRQASRR